MEGFRLEEYGLIYPGLDNNKGVLNDAGKGRNPLLKKEIIKKFPNLSQKEIKNCLFVQTKNLMFTNSIPAVSMIINTLVTELVLLNMSKLLTNIDLTNRLSKEDFLP